jgi:hypothetical protein
VTQVVDRPEEAEGESEIRDALASKLLADGMTRTANWPRR